MNYMNCCTCNELIAGEPAISYAGEEICSECSRQEALEWLADWLKK